MAEIVNLNRFRKARQRAEDSQQAAENRVRFGRSKAERAKDRHAADKTARDHSGKELSTADVTGITEVTGLARKDESEEPA